MEKIKISGVLKKDLRVLMFLLVNGGVTYLTYLFKDNIVFSIIFGASANYIVFRVQQELSKEGYREALR